MKEFINFIKQDKKFIITFSIIIMIVVCIKYLVMGVK